MATEATFTVPSNQFPLGTVFEQFPGVTVELERIIPAKDVVVPYIWVRGTESNDVESAFGDHPGVTSIKLIDAVEDEHLLRVEWALDYVGVLSTLSEMDIVLVNCIGTNDHWTFDVRGDDRDAISAFQRQCREHGIPVTLTKLHALMPLVSDTEAVLTDPQKEALVLAYDRGYFDTPREVTMVELGNELGISQQAVGSRLRRGINQILERTLSETRSPASQST